MIEKIIRNNGMGRLELTEIADQAIRNAIIHAEADMFYGNEGNPPTSLTFGEKLIWEKGFSAGCAYGEELARLACMCLLENLWHLRKTGGAEE